jgi:predicted MFS family arabinose efflux permease
VRLRFQLLVFLLTRTVQNTGFRMVYPFLPAIARGVGVDLSTAALAVTARSTLGMASPLLGSLADRRGRKRSMLLGLAIFALGSAGLGLFPNYPGLVAGLMLGGAGKIVFDAAMQAYLGDRVPYRRRALAIAATEFGWSGAFLVGVPLAGWWMDRAGWNAPFWGIAALTLLAALAVQRTVPADPRPEAHPSSSRAPFAALRAAPAAATALLLGVLVSTANETISIVYGAWLERAFELRLVALGTASAVIGIAELGGEGLVAALADRLGKRRAVALGSAVGSLSYLALPSLARTLPGALLGLFLVYLTFEFTLVSIIPLMTELLPSARGTIMSANIGAQSAGRALGALLGPALFQIGIHANAGAACALNLGALAVLLLFVRVE